MIDHRCLHITPSIYFTFNASHFTVNRDCLRIKSVATLQVSDLGSRSKVFKNGRTVAKNWTGIVKQNGCLDAYFTLTINGCTVAKVYIFQKLSKITGTLSQKLDGDSNSTKLAHRRIFYNNGLGRTAENKVWVL